MPPKRKLDDGPAMPHKRKLNDGSAHTIAGWESWKDSSKNPEWTATVPSGPNGKAALSKYCLLPPYDSSITENQWKQYLDERADLDKLNSLNSSHERFKYLLYCEELGGDYSSPLRNVSEASSQLATEILGTAMDKVEKLAISRTLRGSLYILRLDGENDDGEPRSVEAKLRLYAPHGLGKSIDFDYCYHHRVRMSSVEHLIYITAFVRTIEACGQLNHYESWTQVQNPKSYMYKDRAGVITIFRSVGKSPRGTTPVKLQQLENVILGREGVMSTSKLFKVLCAASTIGTWEEPSYILKENLAKITAKSYKATLASETDGLDLAKEEAGSVDHATLKFDDPGTSEDGEEVCVPLKLLQLARSSAVEA